jgi:hypothetical protein
MKRTFFLILLLSTLTAFSQQAYWQQQVNYKIDVSLNDKTKSLNGFATIEYINQSPDKLDYIWFHLWPNAYKNENTAFAKQILNDADGKKRLKDIKEKGFIDSLQFKVNNAVVKTEAHPEHIDIIKVLLPSSLAPGQKVTITTPFRVKLATYSSRSGFDGQSYMICQWYPKPAVYDRFGWHPMPYLDQGEFYSEFGNFQVNITLPSQYIVGATGVLQTKEEADKYKELGKQNLNTIKNIKYTNQSASKTLSYTANDVHDFAFFADKNYIIEYDTLQLASGKVIDVFGYHHPDGNKHWEKSVSYIKNAVTSYSSWIGEYPYPVAAAVEGPKNDMSGGMEYPMITLITSPKADEEELDAVITHEVGHNWFYGILGSNERVHPWMDEGLNTYYQFRYEAEKYKSNSVFGSMIPKELKMKSTDEFLSIIYNAMSKIPMTEAIETAAADFKNKDDYGMVAYLKTSVWMFLMELELGKENVDAGMRNYFSKWKFKHPYPEDFKKEMESAMNKDLTPFFENLKKKGNL